MERSAEGDDDRASPGRRLMKLVRWIGCALMAGTVLFAYFLFYLSQLNLPT